MEDEQMSIGQDLRDARRAAKLTQNALASKLGVHGSHISNVENGHKNPSFQLLTEWMKACGQRFKRFELDGSRGAIMAQAMGDLDEPAERDLFELIAAWPVLPDGVRLAIMGLVRLKL